MTTDPRVAAAGRLAAMIAEHLEADLSLKTWDGSIFPLGPNARDDIRIVIRSPLAIRRMMLKPRLTTIFDLYARKLIDIEGGTPREAVARWDHLKMVHLRKKLGKWAVLRNLLPFLSSREPAHVDPGYENFRPEVREDKDFIQFHYDISNDFYRLFLDERMVYSSAFFHTHEDTLDEAQYNKLDRICRKLNLKPGEHVFDLGCGWGGLIIHAAQHYGVKCLGATLSEQQYDYVTAKVKELGLEDSVRVQLCDFREVTERDWDAVIQIEMFEHIGLANQDKFFQQVHGLLKPHGRYLHQASVRRPTWDPADFAKYTGYQKAITKYIFPGGELDHIGMTVTNLERNKFEVHDVESLREHYIKTLNMWVDRIEANYDAANELVGEERTRLWVIYLTLFAIGFGRVTSNCYHTVATKREIGLSGMPLNRPG